MSPTAYLLATGHESGGLDGLAFFVEICLFLCVAFVLLVIVLVISGVVRGKKNRRPSASSSEPPAARGVDDHRR